MSVINPSSTVQEDSVSADAVAQKSTNGAAHVLLQAGANVVGGINGAGINVAASTSVNTGVAADVNAAVAAAAGLRLIGFACQESAATPAAASFVIVHGATVAGGTKVVPVKLSANESRAEWFGAEGIAVANGISIDWVSGAFDLNLFYKTVA